jgi:hypothetical protein
MWRAIRVAVMAALLLKIVPASADAFLEIPLEAGQFTSVTYAGPNAALFTATFDAVGEIGGAPVFIPPDGEIWSWTASGPFGLGDCARDTPGPCGNFPVSFSGVISDGTLMFTMSISGSCSKAPNFDPCPGFSLSPLAFMDIDISEANPGDLFLTATPLPATLPLLATGIGVMGFFGWRRKQRSHQRL